MFTQLSAYSDLGLLLLRLSVAVIFLYHALPKIKNAKAMAQGMGTSSNMVMGLGLVEFFSALALLLGVYTQIGALLIAIIMLGAIHMKMNKWKVPFAAMDKTGWELDLILLGAALAILFTGGGSFSFLQ